MHSNPPKYVDDYLYRLGLQCPVKVQYLIQDYPVSEKYLETLPFHAVSRRLLKNLIRLVYPNATVLRHEDGFEASSKKTTQWMHDAQDGDVGIEPLIIHEGAFVAKAILIIKKVDIFELYHLESKAVAPKYNQADESLLQTGNWSKRFQKATFNLHFFEKNFPQFQFNSYLLFPHKYKTVPVEGLSQVLYSLNNQDPQNISLGERSSLNDYFIKLRIDSYLRDKPSTISTNQRNNFTSTIERIQRIINLGYEPKPPIGITCKNCEYRLEGESEKNKSGFYNCWSNKIENLNDSIVFDLVGTSGKEYLERGIILQKDVPVDIDLTSWVEDFTKNDSDIRFEDRSHLQLAQSRGYRIPNEIIRTNMYKDIQAWKYPLYFLDFETITLSVANHASGRPYYTYIPQFSLHKLTEKGDLTHHQWLAQDLDIYTDIRMMEALADLMLDEPGTLIHFSPTEYVMMKSIRKRMKFIKGIPLEVEHRVLDLMDDYKARNSRVDFKLFIEKYYYNHFMRGSLSLKSIYSAICNFAGIPNRYLALGEEKVSNGNDALNALFDYYCDLYNSQSERDRIELELMEYCAIDTLSMIDMLSYFISQKPQNIGLNLTL